ncbi:large ribosomal subunit protein P1-like [Cynocephalus volans]|uniref:large ribosomal subunit protein P1-like n=1 Tax=Cynocephalus volans TaxID=110931 RepID=UPI002FC96502
MVLLVPSTVIDIWLRLHEKLDEDDVMWGAARVPSIRPSGEAAFTGRVTSTTPGSTSPALAWTVASVSKLTCIYLALIPHDNEVTAMANVNFRRLICNVGAGGPAPAAGAAPVGGPAPSSTTAPAEEKQVEEKKEKSGESDDNIGFGLFD